MTNRYHIPIETPEANLAQGMRQLNGVYAQRFNRTRDRVGHMFQGRYKAILAERDSYLLELARYVVLNPLRAKMVKQGHLGAESFVQDMKAQMEQKPLWAKFPAPGVAQLRNPWRNSSGAIGATRRWRRHACQASIR